MTRSREPGQPARGVPDADADADAHAHSHACTLGDYPSASTTGVPAGTTLTAYTGPSTITVVNTVLSGKKFTGCITVAASGVVIRNSLVSCRPGYAAVEVADRGFTGTRLLLEDVEITCQEGSGIGVGEAHVTLRRVNLHGCENGVDVNQDITVEDSFIHDLYNGNDAHADGIQLASRWTGTAYVQGAKNVIVRHNTIYSADAGGPSEPRRSSATRGATRTS